MGLILLVPLVLIAMARIEEIAAIAFGRPPQRLLVKGAAALPADGPFPKVSIHVPAYFEPVSYTHLDVYKRQSGTSRISPKVRAKAEPNTK